MVNKLKQNKRVFIATSATLITFGDSFNTSNVVSMEGMFSGNKATTLGLSSFDTSNVTNMYNMFLFSHATTGYARTPEDADRFNTSSSKPAGLTFVVKH